MADEETKVMVCSRSLTGELLASGVGKVVCLGDAHFLLLTSSRKRGEVGRWKRRGRRRKGGVGRRRSSRHGDGREDVEVLMSSSGIDRLGDSKDRPDCGRANQGRSRQGAVSQD